MLAHPQSRNSLWMVVIGLLSSLASPRTQRGPNCLGVAGIAWHKYYKVHAKCYIGPMPNRLFTAEEVADRLKLNRVTVHRWIRENRLPAINLGGRAGYRVRGEDVEALLYQQYGNLRAIWFRVAQAIGEAVAATAEYAGQHDAQAAQKVLDQLSLWKGAQQSALLVSENYQDMKGFYRPRPGEAVAGIAAAGPEAVSRLAAETSSADVSRMFEPLVDQASVGPNDLTSSPLFHVVARGIGRTLCGLHAPLEQLPNPNLIGAAWCAECMRRAPSHVVAHFTGLGVRYLRQEQ